MERQSELSRMIARLSSQERMIDWAIDAIQERPGVVLEIGLGKARTFDHLKCHLPDHQIIAFDFELHAPKRLIEPTDQLEFGDFQESLERVREQLAGQVVLAHADTGTTDPARDAAQSQWLGPKIAALMAPGGLILSDRELNLPAATKLDPDLTLAFPYFVWQTNELTGLGS